MAKVLFIEASPRKEASYSNKIANAFVETYMEKNPGDKIIVLDIFEKVLPSFDGHTVNAKYNLMFGKENSEQEKQAWKTVEEIINEFQSADKYIFSIPMWNFGIPYRLKQYLDIIIQPSYTFKSEPEKGYVGLVTGKAAMLFFARGGDYSDAEKEKALDHQKSYMELVLGFLGFKDIKSITTQPTLAGGPEIAQQKTQEAIEQARKFAITF